MIAIGLFQRLFLRFLLGLAIAFLLFLAMVHLFQQRIMDEEWRQDLREQAHWLALHSTQDVAEVLTGAWAQTHDTIRLSTFDAAGVALTDSHPELAPLTLEELREGDPPGHLAAVEEMRDGGWLAISRPMVPTFPSGLHWELIVSAVLLGGLVLVSLRPLVRSMSTTLRRLTEIAEEVASGQFGKTLDVRRSDELGTLVDAINDMSRKLEAEATLNTRLLHDVSHELRSPLGRIQVMAQTIGLRPGETRECIQGIDQEVALLDRLVGDLVDTARLESGGPGVRAERFALEGWAKEILSRLESRVRSSGVDWSARVDGVDLQVVGDRQRLAQAIGNLVDNAINAVEGRDGARVGVEVDVGDADWSIAVEDNGPGIPAEHLPHLFRRFYRVEGHRGRERGGVGLGLSLVRAIVEAHGGSVEIDSRVDQGTRAEIRLPIEPAIA